MERASVSVISLRHIFAFPGYAPGTIAVNVTWMKRGFNACQAHDKHVSIYLQPFPINSTCFSTFFSAFWPPLDTPLGQLR